LKICFDINKTFYEILFVTSWLVGPYHQSYNDFITWLLVDNAPPNFAMIVRLS